MERKEELIKNFITCTGFSEALTYIRELETDQKRFEWLKKYLGQEFIVIKIVKPVFSTEHTFQGPIGTQIVPDESVMNKDEEEFWYGHLGCDVGYQLDDLENTPHGPFATFNDAIDHAITSVEGVKQ